MNKQNRIKDYTTSISAVASIMDIEKMLSAFNADMILKNYNGGKVEAIMFKYHTMGYKLPANVEKAYTILKEENLLKGTPEQKKAQAERVAWRNIRDWLDAQIAMIRIGQAEIEQVMLPYAYDGTHSLYEKIKEQGGLTKYLGSADPKEE